MRNRVLHIHDLGWQTGIVKIDLTPVVAKRALVGGLAGKPEIARSCYGVVVDEADALHKGRRIVVKSRIVLKEVACGTRDQHVTVVAGGVAVVVKAGIGNI